MSHLHPDGVHHRPTPLNGIPAHGSLRSSSSASSFFHNTRKDGSNSPQKSRSKSPARRSRLVEIQDGVDGESKATPLNISIPKIPSAADTALMALKYLPTPVIVLSSLKTVLLANEAMGRLLGLNDTRTIDSYTTDEDAIDESAPNTDVLKGQSLSQLGIDMAQDGQHIWVSWERFLDGVADQLKLQRLKPDENIPPSQHDREHLSPQEATSNSTKHASKQESRKKSKALAHDVVANVIINSSSIESGSLSSAKSTKSSSSDGQIVARMTISFWTVENQGFFTLTFTSTYGTSITTKHTHAHSRASSRAQNLSPSTRSNPSSPGSPAFCSQCGSLPSPAITSPTSQPTPLSPFPPMGPPSKADSSAAPAIMSKLSQMKDAIINAMDIPLIAMWRDESVSIPNKAAHRMMAGKCDPTNDDSYDALSHFQVFDANFEREFQPDELPIVRLCRTQKPFKNWKIGMLRANGERSIWDASGEGIYDERTGEFLGGIVSLKDVTKYDEIIKTQTEENERRFEMICETMPQMLWTTTPQGSHDWFSKRWYDYTGQTVEESLGEGWQLPFHPDDMPETEKRWVYALETGNEYVTEYRCKSHKGEWRWMLGRALPLRDNKTGKILKWFGTCTDIHDLVEARRQAKETRERLLNVIYHAKTAVWAVDANRTLKFLEGRLIWEDESHEQESLRQDVGRNIYDVFMEREKPNHDTNHNLYKHAIEDILDGDHNEREIEHYIPRRKVWCRTRFIPVLDEEVDGRKMENGKVNGVIGISIDVTEMKERDKEIEKQNKENLRLLSAETAAKEASKLKSQFLANMSHEIRTPIAGVIGMSELLLDTSLDEEQEECAENIQRSANGLLTVINDILDLSKVESGKLDFEEVRFSLSVAIKDVCKMLSFAAERKNLTFEADVQLGHARRDFIVLGDPGRIRQILTNLLTNSIKFTSDGYVKLAVKKQSEDDNTVTVAFTVEDSGIGIEEEVRKRLFKPFSQADSSTARRFGGTGLGLTICKNLVERMNGEIHLDSELDQGTKAIFSIPFNKPNFTDTGTSLVHSGSVPERLQSELSMSGSPSDIPSTSATPPMSPMPNSGFVAGHRKEPSGLSNLGSTMASSQETLPDVDRSKVHVLVVEDNAINQQIATKTVKKYGFSVNAVWNGKEALDYLAAESDPSRPKPDIILMDVQMPVLDGYRATHMIRCHDPYSSLDEIRNLPIIAMTASAIQGDKEKCQSAGMDDYLAKPVKGVALERMLVKWAIQDKTNSRHLPPEHGTHHDDSCTRSGSSSFSRQNTADSRSNSFSVDKAPKTKDILQAHEMTSKNRSLQDETADGRERSRVAANEKAASLREEKLLLAASNADPHSAIPHMSVSPPPATPLPAPNPPLPSLTEANINQLSLQHHHHSGSNNSTDSVGMGIGVGPGGLPLPPSSFPRLIDGSANADAGSSLPGDSTNVSVKRDSSDLEREGMSTVGSIRAPKSGNVRGWLNRHESDRSQVTLRAEDFRRASPRTVGGAAEGDFREGREVEGEGESGGGEDGFEADMEEESRT